MPEALNVAVIDYDAGNTLSVTRALEKVGARVDLTSDPERVAWADAVVLPGVGAFGDCMKRLAERGMDEACREAYAVGKPFLGVCVGLQVLFEGSEESPGPTGLGILPARSWPAASSPTPSRSPTTSATMPCAPSRPSTRT